MRQEDRQALVVELAADFPLFPVSTIERWADRAAAGYEAARVPDATPLIARAVRATLEELSRSGVTTSQELPLARAGLPAATDDVEIDLREGDARHAQASTDFGDTP